MFNETAAEDHERFEWGGQAMLKSEKRESQKFKKRYGPRRHKLLGINKWTRKQKELQERKAAEKEGAE